MIPWFYRRIPPGWTYAAFGIVVGVSGYTFFYAQGTSYLSNDPRACVNCHVMREPYDGWHRSSHHRAASCNACHTPHDVVGKYATKAINGWNHSVAFTLQRFPEPIRIRPFNARIVRENCIRCHEGTVDRMRRYAGADPVDCVRCHGNVGHTNRY